MNIFFHKTFPFLLPSEAITTEGESISLIKKQIHIQRRALGDIIF